MLLAVDVGNTNISFGLLEEGKLVHHLRSQSARERIDDLTRRLADFRAQYPARERGPENGDTFGFGKDLPRS